MIGNKGVNRDDRASILFEAIKHYGLIEVLKIIFTMALYKHGKKLILFALSNPRPINKAVNASTNHVFKFVTEDELKEICQHIKDDVDNYPSDNDFKQLSSGSCRCLVQLDGNSLVGYAWIWNSKLAYIIDGFHLNLPDDTIYNYKGYTNPKYRGYGFQAIRHLKLLELLKNEGIKRLFGYVDRTNPRSLRGVAKSGYLPVGQLSVKRHKNGSVSFKLKLDNNFWSKEVRA
jgi:hypothetical protein